MMEKKHIDKKKNIWLRIESNIRNNNLYTIHVAARRFEIILI